MLLHEPLKCPGRLSNSLADFLSVPFALIHRAHECRGLGLDEALFNQVGSFLGCYAAIRAVSRESCATSN
jgi:hypothetical protein